MYALSIIKEHRLRYLLTALGISLCALLNGAELIIADEPTGSLASQQGMAIVELIRKSCIDENRCVIIASHDERIVKMADRVLYLSDGEMVSVTH